jgi:hypothetical protein
MVMIYVARAAAYAGWGDAHYAYKYMFLITHLCVSKDKNSRFKDWEFKVIGVGTSMQGKVEWPTFYSHKKLVNCL